MSFDVEALRADFPALDQEIHGYPLAYLDNASTTLKPRCVIDAVREVYERDCANIHRGVHTLSQRATARFEEVRSRVAAFLGGVDPDGVVFLRGTTEAMNLVAQSLGAVGRFGPGDEIVITEMEHHSNLVPWFQLSERTGAQVRVWPMDDKGQLVPEPEGLINPRTRVAAVSHISNAIGTINPVRVIADRVHAVGGLVVVDGAQAAPHLPLDMEALGADAYAFSGHKTYGPTGAGVLWMKEALRDALPPWQGGGEMIASVSLKDGIEYAEPPHRFEAGTPDIAAVVGLGAALKWLDELGLGNVLEYEKALLQRASSVLANTDGVRLVGTASEKAAVASFIIEGVHPHDAGTILDTRGIAVRTGHHCAEPVMHRFGVDATVRASFAVYNQPSEIERLAEGIKHVQATMGVSR